MANMFFIDIDEIVESLRTRANKVIDDSTITTDGHVPDFDREQARGLILAGDVIIKYLQGMKRETKQRQGGEDETDKT